MKIKLTPPSKMKKGRFARKELSQLKNIKMKSEFSIAEFLHKPIMRKNIKRLLSLKYTKLTNTQFLIEDFILPPKYIKKTNTQFLIEDVLSPHKSISGSPPSELSPNPYCTCSGNCNWCKLHCLLENSSS